MGLVDGKPALVHGQHQAPEYHLNPRTHHSNFLRLPFPHTKEWRSLSAP